MTDFQLLTQIMQLWWSRTSAMAAMGVASRHPCFPAEIVDPSYEGLSL
jgi:hypothetical protein